MEHAHAELDGAGDRVRGAERWLAQTTPPLPVQWPAGDDRRLALYRYGTRFGDDLRDAVYESEPWARVLVDPRGGQDPVVDVLTDSVSDGEPQGVRPLTQVEADVSASGDAAERRLVSAMAESATPGMDRVVGGYYALWRATNGVTAGAVRRFHPGFFAALDEVGELTAADGKRAVRAARQDAAAAARPGDLICPACGAFNDPGRRFCRVDGTDLRGAEVVAPDSWWRRLARRGRDR